MYDRNAGTRNKITCGIGYPALLIEVPVQQALSGTGGGDRTRTALSGHRILSPARLPISPPRSTTYYLHRCDRLRLARLVELDQSPLDRARQVLIVVEHAADRVGVVGVVLFEQELCLC